jgi:hypothetical protein
MRTAELILIQPDGNVKRLVLKSSCDDPREDHGVIKSICEAMGDHVFRSGLSDIAGDDGADKVKSIWKNGVSEDVNV